MMSMNSGYSGWSMSNRAVEAYEQGEKPKSKWTKKAMVAEINAYCESENIELTANLKQMKKAEVFSTFFKYSSWHHTSSKCNRTNFYSLDSQAVKEHSNFDFEAEKARKALCLTAGKLQSKAAEEIDNQVQANIATKRNALISEYGEKWWEVDGKQEEFDNFVKNEHKVAFEKKVEINKAINKELGL